jgi:hypothetical protein
MSRLNSVIPLMKPVSCFIGRFKAGTRWDPSSVLASIMWGRTLFSIHQVYCYAWGLFPFLGRLYSLMMQIVLEHDWIDFVCRWKS